MKIAFFEIKGWEKAYIKKRLKKDTLVFFKEPVSEQNISKIKGFDVVSVFIYSKVTGAIIKKLPRLKLITTRSTGFDHIDLKAAKKKKIFVCNVPFYGENTVAEHTFALILSLSRNIHKSYMRTIRNDFSIEGLKGFDLKGKTLGVIGAGHIGLHVIRIAKSFGMRVIAFDVNKDTFLSEVLGFEYAELDDVLKKSDIITLHVPYNKHTHHLINKKNIAMIKKGALLINTSRGKVIDTDALIYALNKKIISGAGLDVLEDEELIKDEQQVLDKGKANVFGELIKNHVLLNMDNVVVTPHIAFFSQEALERILDTTVQNIMAFKAGQCKNNVV